MSLLPFSNGDTCVFMHIVTKKDNKNLYNEEQFRKFCHKFSLFFKKNQIPFVFKMYPELGRILVLFVLKSKKEAIPNYLRFLEELSRLLDDISVRYERKSQLITTDFEACTKEFEKWVRILSTRDKN